MEWLEAVLFGIVQSFTEFLPVSSSGHLTVLEKFFAYSPEGFLFRVVAVHVATLLAVVIVFRRDIALLLGKDRKVIAGLIIASIPAGVFGFLSRDFFESISANMVLVGIGFLTSAFFLLLGRTHGAGEKELGGLSAADSLIVGFAQALAILPGVSRSGSTISMARCRGATGASAASFSFLLMVPAVAGAALLDLKDACTTGVACDVGPVIVSFVCALVFGVIALKLLLGLLRKGKFSCFAYYLGPLGVAAIIWGLIS